MTWLYRLLRFLCKIVFWPLYRPAFVHRERLAQDGPFILVCNHRSIVDPIFLSTFLKRPVTFMAKSELKRVPVVGKGILMYGSFYVNRHTADITAIKKALAVLKKAGILGIFPQGTRVKDDVMGSLEEGVGFLAVKSGAPVIPVYMDARYKVFGRERVIVGEPLQFLVGKERSDSDLIAEATMKIAEALSKLFEERKQIA